MRLFLKQKIGCAGCVFSGENGGGLVRFYGAEKLQQQVFFCIKKKKLIYTAGLGEIFINLFFDLRLDLPIYFIHYIWMISLFWDHLV